MGKLSRNKGKTFERQIASLIRSRFPHLAENIRRSIQSRKAEESDVTGLPGFWLECQDAIDPTPLAKLEQAERDSLASETRKADHCVAITHRIRGRVIYATMRLETVVALSWVTDAALTHGLIPITMTLDDFFTLITHRLRPERPIRKVAK